MADPDRSPPASGLSRAHVCLVGLRGAGKTSVGAALAKRLRRPFHDLDELVLRRLDARSVRAVFEREGEQTWRNGERAALAAFLDAPLAPSVLALGGGAPMVEDVASRIGQARAEGRVRVYLLDCDPRTAVERLARDPGDRASITGRGLLEELDELHRARIDRYREVCDETVDANAGDPDTIAARIIATL
jgi:shikimate kinase